MNRTFLLQPPSRRVQSVIYYGYSLWVYIQWIVGSIGCVLTIVLLIRLRHVLEGPSSQYLLSLATSDLIFLNTMSLKWLEKISYITGAAYGFYEFYATSEFACKFLMVSVNISIKLSTWTLCLFALERTCAVCAPLKVATVFNRVRRRNVIVCQWFITVATEGAMFNEFGIYTYVEDGRQNCIFLTHFRSEENRNFRLAISVYKRITTVIAPYFINISCITLIAAKLFSRPNRASSKNVRNISKQEATCIKNLVAIVSLYIILSLPNNCVIAILDSNPSLLIWPRKPYMLQLITLTTATIETSNYALNFFVYTISFKRYRSELRDLLMKLTRFTYHADPY
ncbi:C-C chemokine receptor type 1-like [Tubulanus polymorphus]|uniref:C-C chemokine receptor type 1-like n=1 Tax=Tubulanus polymorphus TaxID=672921 RepID=UPI003DA515E8